VRIGLLAAGATAALLLVAAAGYLVGESSTPTDSQARAAEKEAYDEAFEASRDQAALGAKGVALESGRKEGRQVGSDDGAADADAEIAASQPEPVVPDTNGPNDPCPAGTNFVPNNGCVGGDF
jgi:hypothetical protein